jgi:hypothetical protein
MKEKPPPAERQDSGGSVAVRQVPGSDTAAKVLKAQSRCLEAHLPEVQA